MMDKNYYQDKILKKHLFSKVHKEVSIDSDKKVSLNKGTCKKIQISINEKRSRLSNKF